MGDVITLANAETMDSIREQPATAFRDE